MLPQPRSVAGSYRPPTENQIPAVAAGDSVTQRCGFLPGLDRSKKVEHPDQVYFIRSDQYSFVKQGVPSVFPHAGWLDQDGKIEKNRSHYSWWFKNRYHQPSDEWVPSLNYENMAKEIRADFLIALYLALDPERPRWNRGDIFEKLFAQ